VRVRRRWWIGGGAALALLVAYNGVCFMHARAMTTFVPGGVRTARPEQLGVLEKARAALFGVTVPRPVNEGSPADVGLAFTTERFEDGRGGTLEAWVIPAPDPRGDVLVFHGYAASKDQLLDTARALHDEGWSVRMIDFEGSGGSSGDTVTIGHREAHDVVAAVRWARDRGARRPVLYGFSMGAAAVLRATAELGVEPAAIVLEAPYDRLLSTVRHRFELMGLPSTPSAELLVFWGGVLHGYDGFDNEPVRWAASVRAPTLVIAGARDERARPEEARAVAAAAGARLVLLPDHGHVQCARADPDTWRREVPQFLTARALPR